MGPASLGLSKAQGASGVGVLLRALTVATLLTSSLGFAPLFINQNCASNTIITTVIGLLPSPGACAAVCELLTNAVGFGFASSFASASGTIYLAGTCLCKSALVSSGPMTGFTCYMLSPFYPVRLSGYPPATCVPTAQMYDARSAHHT